MGMFGDDDPFQQELDILGVEDSSPSFSMTCFDLPRAASQLRHDVPIVSTQH